MSPLPPILKDHHNNMYVTSPISVCPEKSQGGACAIIRGIYTRWRSVSRMIDVLTRVNTVSYDTQSSHGIRHGGSEAHYPRAGHRAKRSRCAYDYFAKHCECIVHVARYWRNCTDVTAREESERRSAPQHWEDII